MAMTVSSTSWGPRLSMPSKSGSATLDGRGVEPVAQVGVVDRQRTRSRRSARAGRPAGAGRAGGATPGRSSCVKAPSKARPTSSSTAISPSPSGSRGSKVKLDSKSTAGVVAGPWTATSTIAEQGLGRLAGGHGLGAPQRHPQPVVVGGQQVHAVVRAAGLDDEAQADGRLGLDVGTVEAQAAGVEAQLGERAPQGDVEQQLVALGGGVGGDLGLEVDHERADVAVVVRAVDAVDVVEEAVEGGQPGRGAGVDDLVAEARRRPGGSGRGGGRGRGRGRGRRRRPARRARRRAAGARAPR